MHTNYLLPNRYKVVGWILFVSGIVAGILTYLIPLETEPLKMKVLSLFDDFSAGPNEMEYFKIIENGIAFELILLAIIFGGLIIGFSKEKVEDEFTYKLRNDSLVWAIIFNYLVLAALVIFIYKYTFMHVLVLNMFTPLLFFIIRFNFLKLKNRSHEE
ncbi:MAG: hypothetical protein AB3N18_09645 [Allomuricauda sp.]